MLADSVTSCASTGSGVRRRSRIRSAITRAEPRSDMCSESTTSSSPPKRATVSSARSVEATASRGEPQHLVAARVPEAVVDGLEAVEVEEEHGQRRVLALLAADRVVEPVEEQHAVRQPGQRVVERARGAAAPRPAGGR